MIRPKQYMADEGNYRESRWFNCWNKPGQVEEYALHPILHGLQQSVPFGDAVLDFADTTIAAEICEELFAPFSPHLSLALAGSVEIFLNGSASHHEIGKLRRRFNLILGATAKVKLFCFCWESIISYDFIVFLGRWIVLVCQSNGMRW